MSLHANEEFWINEYLSYHNISTKAPSPWDVPYPTIAVPDDVFKNKTKEDFVGYWKNINTTPRFYTFINGEYKQY